MLELETRTPLLFSFLNVSETEVLDSTVQLYFLIWKTAEYIHFPFKTTSIDHYSFGLSYDILIGIFG